MTFLEQQQDVYRRLGWLDSPAAAVSNRVKTSLNTWHRKLLTKPGAEWLRADTLTFASVNGTSRYALPQAIARVRQIHETTTPRRLEHRGIKWYRSYQTAPESGTPKFWVPMSFAGAATQPSNASEVFIKSTAAETPTAYVEGVITGGYRRAASVVMTGVTAVSLSTSITNWIVITKVYVSAAATGTITLHEDSGAGTELARIPVGATFARYQTVLLVPTPSAAITYTVDCDLEVPDMSNDKDEPLIPADFHWLIPAGARRDEYEKKGDTDRYAQVNEEIKEGMQDYLTWIANPDITIPATDQPRQGKV